MKMNLPPKPAGHQPAGTKPLNAAVQFFVLLLCLFPALGGRAQDLRIFQSKIITSQNQPVSGATVENLNKILQTTTDANGLFTIRAATGDSLRISATGFSSLKRPGIS